MAKKINLNISKYNEEFYDNVLGQLPNPEKDIIKSWKDKGGNITKSEARFMIDFYYSVQKLRIINGNRISAVVREAEEKAKLEDIDKTDTELMDQITEPHDAIKWVHTAFYAMEKEIYKLLEVYAKYHPLYWFFKETCGIGPVLAASFMAHIDITKAPTAGHIWSYAGLNPNQEWKKGEKRPWNASLKKACYLAAESFVKQKNRPNGYYGQVYDQRKTLEWHRNLSGKFADQASNALVKKDFSKSASDAKEYYSGNIDPEQVKIAIAQGILSNREKCKLDSLKLDPNKPRFPMLPPAHIDARAKRYCVKLFLSHLHECWFEQDMGFKAPRPWILDREDADGTLHTHYVTPPQKGKKPYPDRTEFMEGYSEKEPEDR